MVAGHNPTILYDTVTVSLDSMSRLRYETDWPLNLRAFTSPIHSQSLFSEERMVAIRSETRRTSESSFGAGRDHEVSLTILF